MAICHKCLEIKDMVSYEEQPNQLIAQLPNKLILKVGTLIRPLILTGPTSSTPWRETSPGCETA